MPLDAKLGGDLGFVKFLGIPGDGDTLSVTLAVRTARRRPPLGPVRRPTGSTRACRLLPGPDHLLPARARWTPIGGVRPMTGLAQPAAHASPTTASEPTGARLPRRGRLPHDHQPALRTGLLDRAPCRPTLPGRRHWRTTPRDAGRARPPTYEAACEPARSRPGTRRRCRWTTWAPTRPARSPRRRRRRPERRGRQADGGAASPPPPRTRSSAGRSLRLDEHAHAAART